MDIHSLVFTNVTKQKDTLFKGHSNHLGNLLKQNSQVSSLMLFLKAYNFISKGFCLKWLDQMGS